jgi:hypothetical protein
MRLAGGEWPISFAAGWKPPAQFSVEIKRGAALSFPVRKEMFG